jgi:hypothetical protein
LGEGWGVGKINILKEEGLVDIPNLKPLNCTYTANAFNMTADILKDIPSKNIRINLYTDGNTNNVINDFSKSIKIFDERKIDLHIFAVSDSYKNLEKISIRLEKSKYVCSFFLPRKSYHTARRGNKSFDTRSYY